MPTRVVSRAHGPVGLFLPAKCTLHPGFPVPYQSSCPISILLSRTNLPVSPRGRNPSVHVCMHVLCLPCGAACIGRLFDGAACLPVGVGWPVSGLHAFSVTCALLFFPAFALSAPQVLFIVLRTSR